MASTIEGRNPVIEALKSGRPVSEILVDRNAARNGPVAEILRLAGAVGVPVRQVDGSALDRLSVTRAHQGVIAYAAARGYVTLDDLLAVSAEHREPPLYCVLDGVEDPQNLGAILRTADAAGFHGVVVRERRAVGLTPAAIKASAGAAEYVPVAQVVNISRALETLKKHNVWVIGMDMSGGTDYGKMDYAVPAAIVIGGEGKGLSALVRKRCDSVAFIPMKGKVGSLNASVAAALVMYEAFRQRSR